MAALSLAEKTHMSPAIVQLGVSPYVLTACACQYHPVLIEELDDARENVQLWSEHIKGLCAVCWRVSCCQCEYVFDDDDDAAWMVSLGTPYVWLVPGR